MKRAAWDRRYTDGDRAGGRTEPTPFLVAELAGQVPVAAAGGAGRALDLACGSGANAVWLAERGWRVTAVDFSAAALALGRRLAAARHVDVEWIEADLVDWVPAPGAFALVCLLYLQIPAAERRVVLARAAAAVAAGGTLLVLGHDLLNLTEGWGGPKQADVLFTPDDVVADLDGFVVERAERVRRAVDDAGTAREAIDLLVRARRR